MSKLLAFFFSALILSSAANACSYEEGRFYNNLRPHLAETSLQTFYVQFGGSLDDLNKAISGQSVVSNSGSKKEPVFPTVADAMAAKQVNATFVLGFTQAERKLKSAHDARTGRPLTVASPKDCGNPRVAAQ